METSTLSEARFGGLVPHSCFYCTQIIVTGSTGIERKASGETECRFTYTEVEQASRDGCPLFKERFEFLQNIKQFKSLTQDQLRKFVSLAFLNTPLDDQDFCFLDCEWQLHKQQNQEDECNQDVLHVLELKGNKNRGFTAGQPINLDPGSPETFKLIQSWSQRCWAGHSRCMKAREQVWSFAEPSRSMPARLLEVGPVGGTNVVLRDITIDQDTQIPNQYKYIALSYCWGDIRNFTLLNGNVHEFRHGIALTNLPRTIRQAIYIARVMGLPYIWIDALCIIQDDGEDKTRELPKMAAIYAGAMVVISAAVAESCDHGFLHRRNLSGLLKAVYRLPYHPIGNGPQEGYFMLSEGSLNDSKVVEHIDKRGWTLQEHIQAVSLLRFGSRQVRWTCQMSDGSEIDGGNIDSSISTELDPAVFDGRYHEGDLAKPRNLGIESIHDGFCDHWRKFVGKYRSRSLSCPNDSLPALGAIAQNYTRTTKGRMGRYCAGLWESDLARQLLWFKPNPLDGENAVRLKPSWSWVSLRGPIEYPDLDGLKPSLKIISCVVERHDKTWAYGSVTSGILTVEAQLRPLFWREYPFINTDYEAVDWKMPKAVKVYWDTMAQWDLGCLFCMEILMAPDADSNSKGLILNRLQGGDFERLGYYECPGYLVSRFDSMRVSGYAVYNSHKITVV